MHSRGGEFEATVGLDRLARAFSAMRLASSMLALLGFTIVVVAVGQELHVPSGPRAVNSFTVLALIAIFLIAPPTWFAINAMRPIFLLPILAPFAWVNIEYYGYARRAGASFDFKNTIDMLIMMTPIGFMLWGAFCGMLLKPWERAMVRSLDRGAGYLTVLRFAFGVWPGLKRSGVQAVISVVLMYASQIIHGLSLVVVAAVVLMAAKDSSARGWSRPFGVNSSIDDLIVPTFLTLLAVAVSLLLSAGLRSLGRWVSRQSFERQVGRDQRSPILFLRAFKDDQATLPPGRFFQRLLRAELGRRRLDHVLVEEFSRFGPIVALGRPGERIRPFGAARVYVEHSDWQVRVHDLAVKSAHIVLVVDEGAGLAWEIETMLEPPLREKTIFLVTQPLADLRACGQLRSQLADIESADCRAIGAFQSGCRTVTLYAATPSPETYIVALQAFFRRRQLAKA